MTTEERHELLRRTRDYWQRQSQWMAMDTTYGALVAQWNALPNATEHDHEHQTNNPNDPDTTITDELRQHREHG